MIILIMDWLVSQCQEKIRLWLWIFIHLTDHIKTNKYNNIRVMVLSLMLSDYIISVFWILQYIKLHICFCFTITKYLFANYWHGLTILNGFRHLDRHCMWWHSHLRWQWQAAIATKLPCQWCWPRSDFVAYPGLRRKNTVSWCKTHLLHWNMRPTP